MIPTAPYECDNEISPYYPLFAVGPLISKSISPTYGWFPRTRSHILRHYRALVIGTTNTMFVNNVTYLKQQPLAIHYDMDQSHSIVNDISGNGGGATRNNTSIKMISRNERGCWGW